MTSERFNKNRKRQGWKDLPAFLDASASVSATTFGARRLPEIKALWSAQSQTALTIGQEYKSDGGKTSSRHLRRRTTSHLPRKRHRYPRGKPEDDKCEGGDKKRPCRRARRKPAPLREQHRVWQFEMRAPSSAEHVYWLTTHIWHAKRFHMHDNLFGWKVPLVHANRGARAALRMAIEHHTLIQDVTWRMQPILLGSCDLKSLISSVQRICPSLLAMDAPNSILSGSCFGEGMLHEQDKFPTGAIGPAMWWMCGQPLDSLPLASEQKEMWWLHIFVHPAIRATICELLSAISNGVSLLEGPRDLQGGLACFQIRGSNATASIKRALGPVTCNLDTEDTTSCAFDWDKASTIEALHTQVPNLTIASVRISLNGKRDSDPLIENAMNDSNLGGYLKSYNEGIQQWDPVTMSIPSPRIGDCSIILIANSQADPSLSQNVGVCGWDLLCHPSDANNIFQALSEKGDARAIGLVEESLALLDSEPPLPVFPRDYPDTMAGQSYWDGESSEWELLRQSLEQGWGRVHAFKTKQQMTADGKLSLPSVSWSHISTLPENASGSGISAVVVRGDFGKPFVDALARCGHLPPHASRVQKRRRPRRPVRPSSTSPPLQRLTTEEAHAHQNVCESLLESLSLPAIIRCHTRIEGKGKIVAGSRIIASMRDMEEQIGYIDYLLGTTVAGSFSLSRGLAHGVGFVGAARLLHVLSSDHGRSSCVVVRHYDGTRHAELKVRVQASNKGCAERNATISLLL